VLGFILAVHLLYITINLFMAIEVTAIGICSIPNPTLASFIVIVVPVIGFSGGSE
jgi:hypothetical protein